MKYSLYFFAFFLFSCATHEKPSVYDMSSEYKKVKETTSSIQSHSKFARKYLKSHLSKIDAYQKDLKKYQLDLDNAKNSLAKKRSRLNINRLEQEMIHEHEHFLIHYEDLQKVLDSLKNFKEDIESHHHDHDH